MQFQISTPQTMGELIAMQKSRKASKRKSAHTSDMEPSTKKQKILHSSLSRALDQSQACATISSSPADETSKPIEASLPPAQTQSRNTTDLDPTGAATKKRKLDDCCDNPLQVYDRPNHLLPTWLELERASPPPANAQAHNMTEPGPATKKQKLSYANLPPATVRRKRLSKEELDSYLAHYDRRLIECWRRRYGHDYQGFSRSSDESSLSPDFRVDKYITTPDSGNRLIDSGAPESGVSPFNDSSTKKPTDETPDLDAHQILTQEVRDTFYHSPALNAAIQVYPVSGEGSLHQIPPQGSVSRERLDSGNEIFHSQFPPILNAKASVTFGGKVDEACLSPSDQTSSSLSSVNSTIRSSEHYPPGSNVTCNTRNTSSDQSTPANSVCDVADRTATASSNHNASASSDRDIGQDTAAVRSDQIAPLSPYSNLGDNATHASSSRTPSIGPPRNLGGRPRGRKPLPPKKSKTPKGPARFQKNHPVKAAVIVDVWENILSFCPPDFLLKARTVSSTFRSVLKDDSPIWKISRLSHFGPDMPNPPSGLSEPQYADLLTGTGCQTRGCSSKKTRKTYWAFQKRLCMRCFEQMFTPPRALGRVFKELEKSGTPQYRSIAHYYQNMEEFLPGLKFDRRDNYQWLGDYYPTPPWGHVYRSGQYTAFPASSYATFSCELAAFVGNKYDVEQGRFSSNEPMPGKTCPPQDAIDAWFDMKRAANSALVPELQAVENWCESYKRNNQKVGRDFRKNRESFYKEQAELAGFDTTLLQQLDSYQAAIAISKPASLQSWNILQPKLIVDLEFERELEREVEREMERIGQVNDETNIMT